MERNDLNTDFVDLGDAAELTRGGQPAGARDSDGNLRKGEPGLSHDA
jgi:hypothetical protein